MTGVAELLAGASIERREAEILLQHSLGCDRVWLIAHGDEPLDAERLAAAEALLARRAAGEPVAYLTGEREFWSLPLRVSEAVLIPRPDTEVLVSWALELASDQDDPRVLDLGTGSGAIALALKSAIPELEITAVDASPEALGVAQQNSERLALPLELLHSDWFGELAGRVWPLIVSNPPYIASNDPHLGEGDLPAEPLAALVSGVDGLDAIRHLVASAGNHLRARGWLLLEHGYKQGDQVRRLLEASGFDAIETRQDLAGHERVTGGCWHGR